MKPLYFLPLYSGDRVVIVKTPQENRLNIKNHSPL